MKGLKMIVSAVALSLCAWGCGGEDTGSKASSGSDTESAETSAPQDDAASVARDAGPQAPDPSDASDPTPGAADGEAAEDGVATPEQEDTTTPEPEDTTTPEPEDTAAADPEDIEGGEAVSFQTVFNEILDPMGCTAGYCHAGHAGGMLMDSLESAYDNLVNVEVSTPTECGVTMRVVPGDPEASMLWIRVRPSEDDCLTEDQKMPPFGGEGLTQAQLDLIYAWIATGANP